ncbi:AbrB/MazE/SpoVT family DNA-binding domain-containing protein [Dokdonella soli]|uniref:SpoVT-AbrB domain-containing protein n=1 Tax=Dokdonella soli TaxID=529810 RepID=A0ABP3U3N9_9GAMM
MSCTATLRRSGGSVILSIPKTIVESLAVDAGSVVELSLRGRSLSVTPARRSLAERLAASPRSPTQWQRDDEWLEDAPQGREGL